MSAAAIVKTYRHRAAPMAAVAGFPLYPRIRLEVCYVCAGRGVVPVLRARKIEREPCANCAGRGTIVTDNAP